MEHKTDNKIILITCKTRLENLVYRYNTVEQARFYIEHHGGDFSDYAAEHDTYCRAVKVCLEFLQGFGRVAQVDRAFVPNYLFGADDLVVAVGRDGLVANVMKYLTTQRLIGVNPDPGRWDGVLLPFRAEDLKLIVPDLYRGVRKTKSVTLAKATLNDGQVLYGVNDLFIGRRTHASARYSITVGERTEVQSSSGIIVSTGLGSTGWLKSVVAGARGIERYFGSERKSESVAFPWDARKLVFSVREPYPSRSTGADIVFGSISEGGSITVDSYMAEEGVIFSDGMEEDHLSFNSGSSAEIRIAEKSGMLVV
ncbi:MAG: sugar kinase [Ruminococcaceae bacterium]|nr:sugar kinase [Oscillospiraceae bacterium]